MKNNYLIILILSIRAMYLNSGIWGLNPDIIGQLKAVLGIKKYGVPSLCYYDIINNIEKSEFLDLFPSGVSWSVYLVDLLFDNIFISLYVFCFFCILVFYFFLFKIIDLIEIKLLYKLIIFLFLFLSNALLIYGGVSDVLSITGFVIAIYYILVYIKELKILNLYIASIILWITFFSRFAYYPIVFTLPVALFIYNFFVLKNKHYKPILFSTLILFIGIILQNIYIRFHSQHLTFFHIYKEKTFQIYFDNLIQQDYFTLHIFFPYLKNIFKNLSILENVSFVLLWLITISITLLIFYLAYKKYRVSNNALYKYFCWFTLFTLSINVGMLVLLSLKYAPQNWLNNGFGWTYVQETRYYMPSIICIFIIIVFLLEEVNKIILYFLYISIFYYSFIFAYYIYKFNTHYESFKEGHTTINWTTKELKADVLFLSSTNQDYVSGGGLKINCSVKEFFEKSYKIPNTKKIVFLQKDSTVSSSSINENTFETVKIEKTPYFKAYWLQLK